MKKLKFLFYPILLICSIFLMQSCSNSDDEVIVPVDPTKPETYRANVSFTTDASIGTKIKIGFSDKRIGQIIRVDWGDGKFVNEEIGNRTIIPGTTKGKTIRYYLSDIQEISIYDSKITSIDLSQSPNLTKLDLVGNSLPSIDLSKTPLLKEVYLDENKLTKIDISNLSQLEDFSAMRNELTTVDLTKNPQLRYVSLGRNKLKTLDFTKNPKLTSIGFDFNEVTTVDLSQNLQLYGFDGSNNPLVSLDVTKNTKLLDLALSDTPITNIDLSKNQKLNQLELSSKLFTPAKLLEIIKVLPTHKTDFKGTFISYEEFQATTAVKTALRAKNWDMRLNTQIVN